MLRSIFIGVILSVLAGAGGYVWHLRAENAALSADNVRQDVLLRACAIQTENIRIEREGDAEIDNIDDLRGAAAEWLRR